MLQISDLHTRDNMAINLDRINELARKQKSVGLTEEEKEEQRLLRQEYIESIRKSLRSQLDSIDVIEKDGSVTNLGDKYGHD